MIFDKVAWNNRLKDLSKDVEDGDITTSAWLWIIGGAFLGLITSCLKFTKKETSPILTKMGRMKEHMEEEV